MRHLRMRIDQSHGFLKVIGGNLHGAQAEGAAHGLGIEERAKAGDGAMALGGLLAAPALINRALNGDCPK